MTISNELMYALLSMDSYNRGYGYGLDVAAAGASTTQIGNAAVGLNSNDPSSGIIGGQAAGFFAQSYTLNGQKIIAYRGTDNNLPPPWGDGTGSDAWNGYGTVVGAPFNAQALMAADFFQAVTGTTTANPATGNAILTGHSLGGGLAGFIASIYGQQAYMYDNMAFELAAQSAYNEALLLPNSWSTALRRDFYNSSSP
jgi:hypothetical protein